LLCGSVSVVKEELLTGLNGPLGKDTDPMVAGDHHYLGIAVGINGMVGEPNLVALSGRIHNKIVVQIEEERAHVLVIDFATAIGLVLGNDLPTVLGDELILLGALLEEDAPAGNVRGSHEQVFVWIKEV